MDTKLISDRIKTFLTLMTPFIFGIISGMIISPYLQDRKQQYDCELAVWKEYNDAFVKTNEVLGEMVSQLELMDNAARSKSDKIAIEKLYGELIKSYWGMQGFAPDRKIEIDMRYLRDAIIDYNSGVWNVDSSDVRIKIYNIQRKLSRAYVDLLTSEPTNFAKRLRDKENE
jgi:hypothetical protein